MSTLLLFLLVVCSLLETGVRCHPDQILGVWDLMTTKKFFAPTNDEFACRFNTRPHSSDLDSLLVTLLPNGHALSTDGQSGTWTMIGIEGVSIKLSGRSYLFLSKAKTGTYENETHTRTMTFCNESQPGQGWSAEDILRPLVFKCLFAVQVSSLVGKPVNIDFVHTFSMGDPLAKDVAGNAEYAAQARAGDAKDTPNPPYNALWGHNLYYGDTLPDDFTWQNANGASYIPRVFDQTSECNCSSAAAATHMLMSRVMIASNLSDPLGVSEFLSVQHLLDCNKFSQGCSDGYGLEVLKFAESFGLLTEGAYSRSGNPYIPQAGECAAKKVNSTNRYFFSGARYIGGYFGALTSPEEIQWEVWRNGPVMASVEVTDSWFNCQRVNTENITPQSPDKSPDPNVFARRYYFYPLQNHDVVIVGWGTDDQGDYWVVQNSRGTKFCNAGFTKVRRGTNEYNIESSVQAAHWIRDPQFDTTTPPYVEILTSSYRAMIAIATLFGIGFVVSFVLFLILCIRYSRLGGFELDIEGKRGFKKSELIAFFTANNEAPSESPVGSEGAMNNLAAGREAEDDRLNDFHDY